MLALELKHVLSYHFLSKFSRRCCDGRNCLAYRCRNGAGSGTGLKLFGERWRLMPRSSWLSLRENGLWRMPNGKALHLYVCGRWAKRYVDVLIHRIFPRLETRGKQKWANHYRAKVLTLEQAKAIVGLDAAAVPDFCQQADHP